MKLFGALLIILMVISLVFASGCSQSSEENETGNTENESETERENLEEDVEGVPQEIENVVEQSDRNIMQTLADRNFVTLVELINDAGLEENLAEGIYTIFAPTDEAFAELPESTMSELENNTT